MDGEVIVADANGASNFSAVASAMKIEPSRLTRLTFVAFDSSTSTARDVRARSLVERRAKWDLVKPAEGRIQFSEAFDDDAAAPCFALSRRWASRASSRSAHTVVTRPVHQKHG